VGGGALDKQYKSIKASLTISNILHSGPCIGKSVNKESVSNDHIKYSGHCTLCWFFLTL
jgi:hypothetical protein